MNHESHGHHPPQTSLGAYIAVYVALMVLLGATIGVVYLHLGALAFPIAMLIAIVKGSLVVYYFMHLRQASKIVWIYAIAGFVFLVVLIVFFLADYLVRDWPPVGPVG